MRCIRFIIDVRKVNPLSRFPWSLSDIESKVYENDEDWKIVHLSNEVGTCNIYAGWLG